MTSETDRELLELAAKAAGLEIQRWGCWGPETQNRHWNPLTDDGDALRLAVSLRINIEHMETMGRNSHGINCWPVGRGDCGISETGISDYASATRRAIVRAAAEIGRAMK